MKFHYFFSIGCTLSLLACTNADASYDYIIVGGGTSGLVVANRLTEDSHVRVLVIEVGPIDDGSPGTLIPGIETPQRYHRVYNSTPQTQLFNRVTQLNTAQVVGGGTVINGMFFNRGSAEDYDAWAELGNGHGWSWEGLLPYFKKSENFTVATKAVRDEFNISTDLTPHGTQGPVGSSFPPVTFELAKLFHKAWQALGLQSNSQSNDGRAVGVFQAPLSLTAWNMSRSHASNAYYKGEPSRRPNLTLITGHRVHRVIFKERRAVGVKVVLHGQNPQRIYEATATREVIIAAGAQRSPQILQLSGIGPRGLLAKFNITLMEDLPGVGYNFHDQPSYFMSLTSNATFPIPSWLTSDVASHQAYAEAQLELYYHNRTGAYTKPFEGGGDVAFLPLMNVTNTYQNIIDHADVDLQTTLPPGADNTVLCGQKAQQALLLKHYASPDTSTMEGIVDYSATLAIVVNLKPLSRGSILIASTDPYKDPLIDFGTFMHPVDLEVMLAAFKKLQALLRTSPFAEIELSEVVNVQSDEEIEVELRNAMLSSWGHPVGTLAMLPRDLGGVVDPRLCVYGVQGLRVVDASIMPVIPASHTSSTVYAVAEKAADMIRMETC